jgi:hypothetical protein
MNEEARGFYELERLWSDLDNGDEETQGGTAEVLDSQVGVGSEIDG